MPDLVSQVDMPGLTWARGVPVAMRAVLLKRSRHELLQIYATAFENAGFYIPPDKDQTQGTSLMLTALDTHRLISYTAILQENPNHTTTVILGEANLKLRRNPNEDPNDIPLFPGAEHPLKVNSELGEVTSYEAKASTTEVQSFYQETLTQAGFRQPDPNQPGLFVGQGEEISVGWIGAGKRSTRVVVTVRRRAPTSPEP